MLTIQNFSKICKCSRQTLRYYDRVNLLKPYYTDPSSGYRYYHENQYAEFEKIKDLQSMGFSISEIKETKDLSDIEILGRMENKISQQKSNLEKMIEIKEAYLIKRMRIEDEMNKYFEEMKEVDVFAEGAVIKLNKKNVEARLEFSENAESIGNLIKEMKEADWLIGIDDDLLIDMQKKSDKKWKQTIINDGWENTKELIEDLSPIQGETEIVIHLFLITEKISIYDVNDIIVEARNRGYDGENVLFQLSFSEETRNKHAIIYI